MTGEEAKRVLMSLAEVFSVRSDVSAHEVVDTLSTAMGVVRVAERGPKGGLSNAAKCREYRHRKRHRDGVANGVATRSRPGSDSLSGDLTYQVDSVPDLKTPSLIQPDSSGGANDTDTGVATPKRRWRRVAKTWEPSDAHRRLAGERGIDFELELSRFRDHEYDRPKTDADAAFRNWIRGAKPNRNGARQDITTYMAERVKRLEAEERAAKEAKQ